MRSDREQLDIILQRKKVAEQARAKRRKLVYATFSLVLCVAVLCTFIYTSSLSNSKDKEKAPTMSGVGNMENVLHGSIKDEVGNSMIESGDRTELSEEKAESLPSCDHEAEEQPEFSLDNAADGYENCQSAECSEVEEDEGNVNQDDATAGEDSECMEVSEGEFVPTGISGYTQVFTVDSDRKATDFIKQLSALEDNVSYLPGRENMGIAMAWMLHIGGTDRYYHTVIQLAYGQGLLTDGTVNEYDRYISEDMYYCVLSYAQVLAYAENGYKCLFVGTGLGNDEEMNTFDKAGIEVFCQLYGDMLVAEKAVMY